MTKTETVRRRVGRALLMALLLIGVANAVSCREKVVEDDHGHRDFDHHDHDHY